MHGDKVSLKTGKYVTVRDIRETRRKVAKVRMAQLGKTLPPLTWKQKLWKWYNNGEDPYDEARKAVSALMSRQVKRHFAQATK
jgi:hypothetical protein